MGNIPHLQHGTQHDTGLNGLFFYSLDLLCGSILPRTARLLRSLLLSLLAMSRFFMFSCSSSAGSDSTVEETGDRLSSRDSCGTAPENFSVYEKKKKNSSSLNMSCD